MIGITDKIADYKRHKLRRELQLKRMERYKTGDVRPEPIVVAREYAAELEAKEKLALPAPLRKATGLLSGPDAQMLLKK